MTRALLWILLVGLAITLVILVARHEAGTIAGLETADFAALVAKGALVVVAASAVVVAFRGRFAKAIEAALFWLVLAAVLAVVYLYRADLMTVGRRLVANLVPGEAVSIFSASGPAVEIARARGGEFQVRTTVNGSTVTMILDTGASAVVLTQEAARAAGLPLELLRYDVPVDTANGRTRAASVVLDRVAIGDIVERAVPALVAQPGQLRSSLLGMSFLSRLESWEVRGERLVMRGHP